MMTNADDLRTEIAESKALEADRAMSRIRANSLLLKELRALFALVDIQTARPTLVKGKP